MRRFLTIVFALAFSVALAGTALAQNNPRGKADATVGSAKVTVDYGRPGLKGRNVEDMLGKLGAGEVWRLGADKSTTFTSTADLDFGGTTVPKGDYSLWARKESDGSWKLVFNSQHGQWGTDHDASKDVAAVPLKQEKGSSADRVTIKLENEGGGGEISIAWGDLELSTNFTAK